MINKLNFKGSPLVIMSIISYLIYFISLPIISRNFSSEEFGLLGLFMAITSILGSISTFKIDKSILLPKDKIESIILTESSSFFSISFSILVFVIILILDKAINLNIDLVWYLIPINISMIGLNISLSQLLVKNKFFILLGFLRVFKVSFFLLLIFSFKNIYSNSLIIAEVTSLFSIVLISIIFLLKKGFSLIFSISKYLKYLKKYFDLPKYLIFSDFFTNLNSQAPIMFFSYIFPTSQVGQFNMAKRISDVPINIIVSSLSDLFKSYSSDEFIKNKSCKKSYLIFLKWMIIIILIPSLIIYPFLDKIIIFFLGESWSLASTMISFLLISQVIQGISSPLSFTFILTRKQNQDLYFQILLFITLISMFIIFYYFNLSIKFFVLGYSIIIFLFFIIYIMKSYKLSR